MGRGIALVLLLLSLPSAAAAQAQAPPGATSSFAELRNQLSFGDTVVLIDRQGQTVKGKVQRLSDSWLVLRRGRKDLTFSEQETQRIRRSGHAIQRGALIGLIAGFAAGAAWAASQPCDFTCFSAPAGVFAFGALGGGIGLGVGTTIGAAVRKEPVVFDRRSLDVQMRIEW